MLCGNIDRDINRANAAPGLTSGKGVLSSKVLARANCSVDRRAFQLREFVLAAAVSPTLLSGSSTIEQPLQPPPELQDAGPSSVISISVTRPPMPSQLGLIWDCQRVFSAFHRSIVRLCILAFGAFQRR